MDVTSQCFNNIRWFILHYTPHMSARMKVTVLSLPHFEIRASIHLLLQQWTPQVYLTHCLAFPKPPRIPGSS